MKITRKNDEKKVSFDEISEGEVFFWNDAFLMRIPEVDIMSEVDEEAAANAIDLDDGLLYWLDDSCKVHTVHAELIVEG